METLKLVVEWLVELVQKHPIPAAAVTTLSVLSAMWNNHKNRVATIFGHSMQAITHLDQRWDSPEMRGFRKQAATYLLRQHRSADGKLVIPETREREGLKAVLNFLETVGSFARTGAIGPRTAWQLFGSVAQLYVEAGRRDLAEYQDPRATVYTEMSYLYAVSRVEEDRVNLPGIWFWSRVAAFRLTWRGEPRKGRWLGRCAAQVWNLTSTVFTGTVAEFHSLQPLYSLEELRSSLEAESAITVGVEAELERAAASTHGKEPPPELLVSFLGLGVFIGASVVIAVRALAMAKVEKDTDR